MNRKIKNWLIIFFLFCSLFTGLFISPVVATDPTIILIEDSNDYTAYGFNDLGIYYTPESLTSFHMPFIVERTGAFNNLEKYDLDGNYTKKTGSFDKRFISHSFDILAENDGYYVVDFSMKTFASNETFSVDFIPEIKDIAFPEFAWWNSSWTYYRTITINNTKVSGDEINLPVLVAIDDAIGDKCDGGNSIRFLDAASSTEYNYEIEKWVDGSDRIAWVNVTSVSSSSDTFFLLYYNNSGASDNQTPVGVWDATVYGAVWHSNDASTNLTDSTHTYNTTAVNGTPSYQQTGKVGYCVNYDGSTDYFTYASLGSMLDEATNWTVLAWVNSNEYSASLRTAWSNWGDYLHNIQYEGNASGDLDLWTTDGTDRTPLFKDTPIINSWYMCTLRWNDTDNSFYSYLNKTYVETISGVGVFTAGGGAKSNTIGALGNDAIIRYWYGEIDELWIMTEDTGSDWITTMYNMMDSPSTFLAFGIETVDRGAPTNFSATTTNITSINISWTKDVNSTHTRIQRKTGSYPTSSTNGTNIYNDTGTSYDDVGLDSYTRFYYRAWGYNSTSGNWSNYASSYNNTGPTNPTSVTGTPTGNDLNISWVMGSYANTTVIQRKTNSYPTSPTDGTNIYNSTGLYHVDTSVLQTYYYRLFSWDNNTNLHSSGVNLEWGALNINCYDENTTDALTFNVFITDENGSQTYEDTGCTNTHRIDLDDLPLGDDILIQISTNATADVSTVEYFTGYSSGQNTTTTYLQLDHTPTSIIDTNVTCYNSTGNTESYPVFLLSNDIITIYPDMADEFTQINVTYTFSQNQYRARTYYMDLVTNTMYTLNAYLSNATNLYLLQVIDENNNPIENVKLIIMRYINATAGHENVSILFTGANGEVDTYLIPEQLYKIKLSKTGYETKYENYVPDPEYYGLYYPKTFQLIYEKEEPTIYTFDSLITFNGTINSTGVITICFYDNSGNTTNTAIFIYENYNGTRVLNHSDSRTGNNDFCFTDTGYNTSRMHDVQLHLNHSDLGYEIVWIYIYPLKDTRTEASIEDKFEGVFGEFELGWVKTFIIFFPCILLLVVFGAAHSGLGIMAAGLYLGFTAFFINVSHIATYASLASVIVTIGLTLIVVRKGRRAL